MQKEESERQTLYKDPAVANLLMDLLKSKKGIDPTNDSTQGYRYINVEKVTNKSVQDTKALLKKLGAVGVLSEKVADMVMYCPSCSSADISTNYTCPYCGSPQIIRNALIEHMACGYIDNMATFRREGDLLCPKCSTKIGKDDYRSAGKWYECGQCKRKIENPRINHTCRACNSKFSFDDAKYIEVYQYALSDLAKNEIKSGALFSSIVKSYFLDNINEVPEYVTGGSGTKYQFDVLLKSKDEKIIAIDHVFSLTPLDQSDIMREYGKAFDTQTELYIVASKINEDAAKLAKNIGIKVFVGDLTESLNELTATLKPLVATQFKIKETTALPTNLAPEKKERKMFKLFKKI
jgi:predicted RNA-binding Zn-ribbon protein involved in translation (DUF1610 family)